MHRNKLTAEKIAIAHQMWSDGHSGSDIAQRLGVAIGSVPRNPQGRAPKRKGGPATNRKDGIKPKTHGRRDDGAPLHGSYVPGIALIFSDDPNCLRCQALLRARDGGLSALNQGQIAEIKSAPAGMRRGH